MHKLYEFYKLLHQDCNKYPKTEKYTLGEELKSNAIELIKGAWKANTLPLPKRLILLDDLQRTLDLMKIFVRLVHDLGIYKLEGYIYRQKCLEEIGKMLGKWRKNTRKKLGLDP